MKLAQPLQILSCAKAGEAPSTAHSDKIEFGSEPEKGGSQLQRKSCGFFFLVNQEVVCGSVVF